MLGRFLFCVSAIMLCAAWPGWAEPTFVRGEPAGPYVGLTEADFASARSFRSDEVVLATTYFYWYDSNSGENWVYADGATTLTHHPVPSSDYSYRSVEWHKRQMRDIAAAGIDVILPVYWGDPNRRALWSFVGLQKLVQAQQEMVAAGEPVPRIGLFHAAISLEWGPQGPVDLTLPYGREWFYTTIRDFWSQVPPSRWAMLDGKPLVFLYAAFFAKAHDQSCVEFVRSEFARDFAGRTPYLVRGDGWNLETESQYSWGGAVGPRLRHTAALGPGYDHSAVKGREPLVVDREHGAFYSRAWEMLLRLRPERRPRLVHLETWNELHEATELCETVECGRRYIELTRHYGDLYRAGVRLPRQGAYAAAGEVRWDPSRELEAGLRHDPGVGDGPTAPGVRGGRACRVALPTSFGLVRYLYFQVEDSFAFDEGAPFAVRVVYYDEGDGLVQLQYDSDDPQGSVVEGAFKAGGDLRLGDSHTWQGHVFHVPDARFVNRTHGCDFRLAVLGGGLAVAAVSAVRE